MLIRLRTRPLSPRPLWRIFMNRRKFLRNSAAGALAAGISSKFSWAGSGVGSGEESEAAKRKRIAVSTWSFHNYFAATRDKDFKGSGKLLDLREFPEMIVDKYHIHSFEFCSTHFESTQPSYIQDLKAALAKVHGHVVNMPVDYPNDWKGTGLCDPDDKQWRWEIQERKKWVDIAAELGAESIRPNPGGTVQLTDL